VLFVAAAKRKKKKNKSSAATYDASPADVKTSDVNTAQAATASDICSKCCHHIMPLSLHGEDLLQFFFSLYIVAFT